MARRRPCKDQLSKGSRDCSRVENEEGEESWREGDQIAAQWDKEQKVEEIVERRRIEGSSLKVEVMQKGTTASGCMNACQKAKGEGSKREESARMVH